MKLETILILIIVIMLLVYIMLPKKLKLVATTSEVMAESGMTTFHFDPPIKFSAGTYRIIRLTSNNDIATIQVYAPKGR